MADTPIKLVPKGGPDEVAAAAEQLARSVPAMIKMQEALAKVHRAAYLAYLSEGFTPKQALELVKTIR